MTVEEILAALQAVMDEAKAGEPLTDDQVARYEQLEEQLTRAQRTQDVAKRHAAYNTTVTRVPSPADTSTKDSDEQLNRAFNHYLRTGKENADIVQLRAQGEGVASEGGYLVPTTMRQKLVDRMKAFGGVAEDAETITTSTGEAMNWPTLDDTTNVGEIVKEGNTFTSGADLVFGADSIGAYEYMAGGGSATPLRVSRTLADDAAFDIEGLVSRKLGERIARIQAPHIVSGTGVEEPKGILTGLSVANGHAIEIASATGVTYDDLVHFIHSVDPAYRESGCKWAFNDASMETIKKIKDSHGDPIWRPASADMGTDTGGGTLLGYPVRIDQSFPNINLASNTVKWGTFGNLSEGYVIRRINDVQILVNPYARMAYRQVEYSAWARMDATQQNVNAYIALTGQA